MADLGSSSALSADQLCLSRSPASRASPNSSSLSSRRQVVAPSSFEPSTLLEPLQQARAQFSKLSPNEKAVASAVAACAGTVLVFQGYRKWWRRVRTVDHVLPRMLEGRTWVRGVVTSVGDGDGFRLFHTPALWRWLPFRRIPTDAKGLRNETLNIRIAGVDAPEGAHFGRPAQPLSAEALAYLKDKVEGRRIKCLLLSKDQYKRIVALPMISRPWLPFLPARSLPLMMLRDGWATVYRSAGAEYGKDGIAAYEAAEAEAKKKKRGIWSLGKKLEQPDAYKRRMASGDLSASPPSARSSASAGAAGKAKKDGWWAAFVRLMTE